MKIFWKNVKQNTFSWISFSKAVFCPCCLLLSTTESLHLVLYIAIFFFQRSVVLPRDFPSEEVFEAYLHPVVDESTEQFEWGKPDLHSLRLYPLWSYTDKYFHLSEILYSFQSFFLQLEQICRWVEQFSLCCLPQQYILSVRIDLFMSSDSYSS